MLHLDSNLLLDFVVLCMSAALGGVLAASVGLPETLGYIVGGMVVGPSGANVIYKVRGGIGSLGSRVKSACLLALWGCVGDVS